MKVAEDGLRHIDLESRSDVVMVRRMVSWKVLRYRVCEILRKIRPYTGSLTKLKAIPESPVHYAFVCAGSRSLIASRLTRDS